MALQFTWKIAQRASRAHPQVTPFASIKLVVALLETKDDDKPVSGMMQQQ